MKKSIIIIVFYVLLTITLLVGDVKCIIKMINCNWNPIGKSEVLYTVGTFTGAGGVIGHFNIEDN